MKSPLQLLMDKRNEIQSEYNRVLKLNLSGISTLKHRESFEWGKRVDLDRIKSQINQYNAAIYVLQNT